MAPRKLFPVLIGLLLLSACSLPKSNPALLPTPTIIFLPTFPPPSPTLPVPTVGLPTLSFITAIPTTGALPTVSISSPSGGVTPVPSATFCADPLASAVISSLQTAIQTSDGKALAGLVSPAHGMEVRRYRDGRTVTYDQTHAKFLFVSTYQVKWGNAPGSGLPTVGAFHEVILPAWQKVLTTSFTLACNQLQVGGTTYKAEWLYPGVNFYSLYYPGTAANGNLDWQTLVIGMENVGGRYYIFPVMQFEWEI